MKKLTILILLINIFSIYAFEDYLGFEPNKIIRVLGAPDYLLTERGDYAAADDVVFFYDSRIYIYFNQNKVWQIRVDKEYPFEILGLSMGDSKEKVKNILGNPKEENDDYLLYKRPDVGFPVYVKIFFFNNKINDVYMFRGDY